MNDKGFKELLQEIRTIAKSMNIFAISEKEKNN